MTQRFHLGKPGSQLMVKSQGLKWGNRAKGEEHGESGNTREGDWSWSETKNPGWAQASQLSSTQPCSTAKDGISHIG